MPLNGDSVAAKRAAYLLALALAAVVLPLLLAAPAPGAATEWFHDPLDVTCCTRDLTDVRVHNSDAGTIEFDVYFDDHSEAKGDDDDFMLHLDTDRDRTTGDGEGFDFMLFGSVPGRDYRGGQARVSIWNPAKGDWRTLRDEGAAMDVIGHRITIRIDRHLLGDTSGFAFSVALWEVALGHAYHDFAPDSGAWTFALQIAVDRLRPALTTWPKQPRPAPASSRSSRSG